MPRDGISRPNISKNVCCSAARRFTDFQAKGTIKNDDYCPPQITINDVEVTEGDVGTVAATFTVGLSQASPQPVTVAYATQAGTATANVDYDTTTGTVRFEPNQTSKTVTVPVRGDLTLEPEPPEAFFVNLLNPAGATIADSQGKGTIKDDDSAIKVYAGDASIEERDNHHQLMRIPVWLSRRPPAGVGVVVQYATANDTAAAPADYESKQVVGEKLVESDENFNVDLSSPTNAVLDGFDLVGTATIINDDSEPGDTNTNPGNPGDPGDGDDDGGNPTCDGCPDFPVDPPSGGNGNSNDPPKPTISIDDVTINEGQPAVFTVTLSKSYDKTVSVSYTTAAALATPPEDYRAKRGTITFPPGSTSQRVLVTTVNDNVHENDEHFYVNLSNPSEATLAKEKGRALILDDDPIPGIRISDVTVMEGNDGTDPATPAYFRVSLTNPTSDEVTISYSTADGTAKIIDNDYQAPTAHTFTFAPRSVVEWVRIDVVGDKVYEPTEYFYVNLSHPVYTITDSQGVGTILNDDPTLNLLIDSNNDGSPNEADDPIEENAPGKYILVNDDDDNNNDVTDLSEAAGFAVTGEDDLALLRIDSDRMPTVPSQLSWSLTFPAKVKVFLSGNRTGGIQSGHSYAGPLPSAAYVEGFQKSNARGDVRISLSVSTMDRVLSDFVVATVIPMPDLDVDSDNNNLTSSPEGSRAEEKVEDVAGDLAKPGKIAFVNDNDNDIMALPTLSTATTPTAGHAVPRGRGRLSQDCGPAPRIDRDDGR